MTKFDLKAKAILKKWGNETGSLFGKGNWLRVRPTETKSAPVLRRAGPNVSASQPDGLFLRVMLEDESTKYADVIAVEACGTVSNLADKRSRYFASLTSLHICFRVGWLKGEYFVQKAGTKLFADRLSLEQMDQAISVRHLRVLYCLPDHLYDRLRPSLTPEGHEFFMRYSSMESHTSLKFRSFTRMLSPNSQFFTINKASKVK